MYRNHGQFSCCLQINNFSKKGLKIVMKNKFILAIDQGTTSTRAVIYNHNAEIVGKSQQKFTQYYPRSGWVEHDPEEIWDSTINVIRASIRKAKLSIENICALGITNQRETTVIWNKRTGKPVYNAIVWQCRRTANICEELKKRGLEAKFQEKTGLLIDPYFSGTKIKWILDNIEKAREKAEKGDLLFGTIDSWLIWKLTGGSVHVTDYTNASRTLIYNIHELKWDEELLGILEIPRKILPEVHTSSEIFAKTAPGIFPGTGIPIAGIAGDQQAATFAQGCYKKGESKITYGTGAFVVMNTGGKPVKSRNGLLTTIAWGIDGNITYALEGSIFNAGSAIKWIEEELNLITDAADSEYFARKVNNTDGVYLVPAFTGLGAPYWSPEARGIIVGLNRATNRNHIIRATLESIVYQSRDILEAMLEDAGIELKKLKIDGGAAANNFILQFLADITGADVERPENIETTVTGAAYLAGLATGYWSDKEELIKRRKIEQIFRTEMPVEKRKEFYRGWKRAVDTALVWGKGI